MKHAIETLEEEIRGIEKALPAEGSSGSAGKLRTRMLVGLAQHQAAVVLLKESDIHRCPECHSTDTVETVVERTGYIFDVCYTFKVPAQECKVCEFGWLDVRAENAEQQARDTALCKQNRALRTKLMRTTAFLKSLVLGIDELALDDKVVETTPEAAAGLPEEVPR